jgi:hypothetical protein
VAVGVLHDRHTAERVADEDHRPARDDLPDHLGEVVAEPVESGGEPGGGARAAVPARVIGDNAHAGVGHAGHLPVPDPPVERPAV